MHVTPPTRTARAVAHACGAGCEFSLQVCRGQAGDACAGDAQTRVRVTSRPDAGVAAVVPPPPIGAACGPPATITVPPESRTRVRAVAVDAHDHPVARDRLVLDCTPDPGWLGCVPVTTSSTTPARATTTTRPADGCVISGCSGELCTEVPVASPCRWEDAFGCYARAACARGPDGACGWRPSAALADCLRRYER